MKINLHVTSYFWLNLSFCGLVRLPPSKSNGWVLERFPSEIETGLNLIQLYSSLGTRGCTGESESESQEKQSFSGCGNRRAITEEYG